MRGRAHLAALGVPADQVDDRAADVEHAVGVVEQLLVTAVPRHQPHPAVDHADALADVVERGGQHLAVEAQFLVGLVEQRDHLAQLHARAAQRAGQGQPRRGRADRRGEQAFGELRERAVGGLVGLPGAALLRGVVGERAPRGALADDEFGQREQLAAAHAAGPAAGAERGTLHVGIEERGREQLVLQPWPLPRGDEHERADVEQQRPERAVGERVPADQAEQLLRAQPADAEWAVLDPCGREPAAVGERRQQQRVQPQRRTDEQPRERARAAGAAPVQPADQRRRELRDRRECEQAVLGERVVGAGAAMVGVGHRCQAQDRRAAHPQHLAVDCLGRPQHAAAQQQRHDQVVADHRRQRHAGDDHHAGRGREAADVDDQRQRFLMQRQRQREDVGVGRDPAAAKHRLPGERDRHHQYRDQRQVCAEQPARRAQVVRVLALDDRDMELPRQAHDRGEREQGLGDEAGRQARGDDDRRGMGDARGDAAIAGQVPQREHADSDEREQLDQRFQRDREHHAVVVLGGIDPTRAEQDRKHREHQRDVERRVGEDPGIGRHAGQHLHAHRHRLELQRHVRHRRGQRDHRDQRRQAGRAAVARGQEIGDRDDAVLAGNQHQPLDDAPAEHQHQQRAEVDRQEAQAGARGGADRAVERPRRAVHRQRQRIHRRTQPAVLVGLDARHGRTAVAVVGDREQHADVARRYQQQYPARNHRRRSPSRMRRVYGAAARGAVRPTS